MPVMLMELSEEILLNFSMGRRIERSFGEKQIEWQLIESERALILSAYQVSFADFELVLPFDLITDFRKLEKLSSQVPEYYGSTVVSVIDYILLVKRNKNNRCLLTISCNKTSFIVVFGSNINSQTYVAPITRNRFHVSYTKWYNY